MALNSNRYSGDPVLEACAAGTHRMLAPEENLSVMRVQEGLRRLGYDAGDLDGIFGGTTGAAVSRFKIDHGLSPSDPVVGPGTSTTLDNLLFQNPLLDPDFGELSGFVAAHNVEPFVGLELASFLSTPFNHMRHDIGQFLLQQLQLGNMLGVIAASRALGMTDPRIDADTKQAMANMPQAASGEQHTFTGTDGLPHTAIVLNDLLIRGKMFLTHRPSGRRAKASFRGQLSHELTHQRNEGLALDETPDSDSDTFLDTALAAALSESPATPTISAVAFKTFAEEMAARHVTWIVEQEIVGNPFAARFLPAGALAAAAHFYFAETNAAFLFNDNGYIATIVSRGNQDTYLQIALWLRRCAAMSFSGNLEAQQLSEQLFLDAAAAAEQFAFDPGSAPAGDGLYPGPADFH